LGQILSDQAVGVFIASAFTGGAGMSKIDLYARGLVDLLVQAECDAVIQDQGLPPVWRQGLQQPDQGFGRGRGLPAFQRHGQGESGFSFHQGQDSPFAVASDESVPFPVSVAGPFLHAGWPLFRC